MVEIDRDSVKQCKGEMEAATGHSISEDAARQFLIVRRKYGIKADAWGVFLAGFEGARSRPTIGAMKRTVGVGGNARNPNCKWCQGAVMWAIFGGDGYCWDVFDWRNRRWIPSTDARPSAHGRLCDAVVACPECTADPVGGLDKCILRVPRASWHDCTCSHDHVVGVAAAAAKVDGMAVEMAEPTIERARDNKWSRWREVTGERAAIEASIDF